MQKNLYFKNVVRRHNPFGLFIFNLFNGMSSFPRLLLEVFIRKNFGERYFNMGSVIMAILIFSSVPNIIYPLSSIIAGRMLSTSRFWEEYCTWYVFLLAFLGVSIKRWLEIRRTASTFDFTRYSLYRGDIHPLFFELPIFKKRPDVRTVEILIEPGLFFIIGLFVWLLGQGAGLMLIICSLFYALSYAADYKAGDDYVLDIIDQIHLNRDMKQSFFENDADPNNPRNDNFRGRRPQNPRDWETVVDATIVEDDLDSKMAV